VYAGGMYIEILRARIVGADRMFRPFPNATTWTVMMFLICAYFLRYFFGTMKFHNWVSAGRASWDYTVS